MYESELIIKLQQDSEWALDQICQIYSKRLYCFCYGYTKSKEESQEMVQDAFVKLWLNRSNLKNQQNVGALLFTIVKNQLINRYRSNINSPVYEEYINYCNTAKMSVNDAHHKIEYDDFCAILDRALKTVPKTQRTIFQCMKIDQLSLKETSLKLGLSEQTIKNQLSLCIKVLRGYLGLILWLFLNTLFDSF